MRQGLPSTVLICATAIFGLQVARGGSYRADVLYVNSSL
jgi:hypothetical protein